MFDCFSVPRKIQRPFHFFAIQFYISIEKESFNWIRDNWGLVKQDDILGALKIFYHFLKEAIDRFLSTEGKS